MIFNVHKTSEGSRSAVPQEFNTLEELIAWANGTQEPIIIHYDSNRIEIYDDYRE